MDNHGTSSAGAKSVTPKGRRLQRVFNFMKSTIASRNRSNPNCHERSDRRNSRSATPLTQAFQSLDAASNRIPQESHFEFSVLRSQQNHTEKELSLPPNNESLQLSNDSSHSVSSQSHTKYNSKLFEQAAARECPASVANRLQQGCGSYIEDLQTQSELERSNEVYDRPLTRRGFRPHEEGTAPRQLVPSGSHLPRESGPDINFLKSFQNNLEDDSSSTHSNNSLSPKSSFAEEASMDSSSTDSSCLLNSPCSKDLPSTSEELFQADLMARGKQPTRTAPEISEVPDHSSNPNNDCDDPYADYYMFLQQQKPACQAQIMLRHRFFEKHEGTDRELCRRLLSFHERISDRIQFNGDLRFKSPLRQEVIFDEDDDRKSCSSGLTFGSWLIYDAALNRKESILSRKTTRSLVDDALGPLEGSSPPTVVEHVNDRQGRFQLPVHKITNTDTFPRPIPIETSDSSPLSSGGYHAPIKSATPELLTSKGIAKDAKIYFQKKTKSFFNKMSSSTKRSLSRFS